MIYSPQHLCLLPIFIKEILFVWIRLTFIFYWALDTYLYGCLNDLKCGSNSGSSLVYWCYANIVYTGHVNISYRFAEYTEYGKGILTGHVKNKFILYKNFVKLSFDCNILLGRFPTCSIPFMFDWSSLSDSFPLRCSDSVIWLSEERRGYHTQNKTQRDLLGCLCVSNF